MTLQLCESENLVPLATRVIDTYNFEFSMAQHDTLFIFHRTEHVDYRVITSSDYSNSANIIDSDNATTSSQEKAIPTPPETIIDFLTIATRAPTIRFNIIGGRHIVEYATSNDLTFPAFTASPEVDIANDQEFEIPSTSFRYLKVRITPLAVSNNTQGIAVDSNGNVVLAGDNNIRIFNPTTKGIIKILGKDDGTTGTGDGEFNTVKGIAIDSTGRLIVADAGNDRIQIFDSNYDFSAKFGVNGTADGEFNSPSDVAINTFDDIVVADTGNVRIQKFSSAGVFQAKTGTTGTGDGEFNSPVGVSIDSLNRIYVVDETNDNIQRFNNALTFSVRTEISTTGVADVTVDSSDNVYVLDNVNDVIKTYNTSLVFQNDTSLENSNPVRINVDSSDNVYVTDSVTNQGFKYNSSLVFQNRVGQGVGTIHTRETSIDEIFDITLGGGQLSTMKLQMKDTQNNVWVGIPDIAALTVAGKPTGAGTIITLDPPNKRTGIPYCPAGEIRLQIEIIDGASRDNILLVKAGKQA